MQPASKFNAIFLSALTRAGQLILLNFCFLLCCLPLVTVGAAWSALYAVCFRFGTPRETHLIGGFFRAFRSSLKQGIALWVPLLAMVALAGWCALYCALSGGMLHFAFWPFLALLFGLLIVMGYAFPLIGLFENAAIQTLKNAFILGLGNLPRSVLVVAVNVFPLVLPLVSPAVFARVGIFLLFLYTSSAAWLNSWILKPVFAPFLPEETED